MVEFKIKNGETIKMEFDTAELPDDKISLEQLEVQVINSIKKLVDSNANIINLEGYQQDDQLKQSVLENQMLILKKKLLLDKITNKLK